MSSSPRLEHVAPDANNSAVVSLDARFGHLCDYLNIYGISRDKGETDRRKIANELHIEATTSAWFIIHSFSLFLRLLAEVTFPWGLFESKTAALDEDHCP